MAEVIKTYRMRGGTDDRAGDISGVKYRKATKHMSLEETMWVSVRESAPQDYEQRITVNDTEYDYGDCFDDNKSVDDFKKVHDIDKITSMSYMSKPWSNMLSDIIQLEITTEPTKDLELWHVGWGEFDGWEYELYSGSEVFTSKEAAVEWLKNDYKQRMDDFFGQDPDSDVETELELDAGDFDNNYQVTSPDGENRYAKWTINKTVFKDFFKKKS